jgi:cysteinyl-tRNA synthetase
MHHGMVTVNGKKMSKSGGNFQRIRDLLLSFSPEVIRFFLLSKHYRNPLNFTLKKMEESKSARRGILLFLQEMEKRMGPPQAADFIRGPCWREFCRIMNDDVNTPAGISLIFQAIRKTKKELGQNDKNRLPAEMKKALQIRRADILKIGKDVLGVIPESVPGFRSRIQ